MMKPRGKTIKIATVLAVAVVAGVVAQDLWDDESLFAEEDLVVDESVTGTLPEGESGNDDELFDALFGEEGELDDLTFGEDLGDLAPVDAVSEENTEAFEAADSTVTFPDDLFEESVDTGASAAEEAFADAGSTNRWDADTLLDDMLTTGDQDGAVAETMEEAGLADLFAGEIDDGGLADDTAGDDADLDALFGTLIAEEPATSPAAPDTMVETGELAVAVEAPVPDKGDPAAEQDPADDAEDVDFDALFAELATEAEPTSPEVEPVEEEPVVEVATPVAEEPVEEAPAEEAPVEVAAPVEAAPEPYRDELALDDALFQALAEEGLEAAQATPPVPARPRAPAPAPAGVQEPAAVAPAPPPAPVPAPAQVLPAEPPAVAAVAPVPAAPQPAAPEGTAAFEESERLRRIARENHAVNSLDRAERAFGERDYRRAIQLYEEALRMLPRRDDLEPARARARRGLANAYFRQAAALVEMGDLEGALDAAQGAARSGHRRGPEAVRRIQEQLAAPPVEEEAPPTAPRWEQEDFERIDREIEDWLRRGREAYLTGEYERSILAFESVLARDPENKEAIRMIRAAAGRQYDRSSMELDATRQRMVAAVRDTWNSRQYGIHEEPIDSDQNLITDVREDELQRQQILEKMNAIVIPEVNFRQANIRDVLTFLQQQSVEFDPAEARADRTGVNIILQLEHKRDASAPAATGGRGAAQPDFFGVPDSATSGGSADEVLVTFSALGITLKEALDIVVDVADLKYWIRGNIVMVVPRDMPDGDIIHRMYDVLPSAIARLQDLNAALAPAGGQNQRRGAGDFLALQEGQNLGGEDVDLRSFFHEMGVQWPARSSIKFVRGLGKLVVANTQENLAVFESILSILNVVPFQIEIEARFVEVAQTDVDSLGLEWMLTDTWEIAEAASDAALPPSSRQRIVMDANQSSGGFTQGNRFLSQDSGPLSSPIMDQVMTVSSVLTNPELSLVLHALQQRGHTDLLSAPKITTQSGQQATIKVVTEYIYPTAFETSGIGGGTTGGTLAGTDGGTVGAVVTPLDFQTREVGVILEVLPEVSPEGQMINLLLSPEVVSEPTWRNYGSTYTSFDPNGNPVEQVLNMEQPFFHTRKLRTNLLIYNGATVVMGGMITEVRTSVDDRVPLLGDIPIFGRLFRSQYDSSEKRNLLIFVTARLVDPAGRPLDRERLGLDQGIAERIVGTEN